MDTTEPNKKFGIESSDDKRNKFRKFGPHAWLGLIAGGLAGLAMIAIRDTVLSAIGTFETLRYAGWDMTPTEVPQKFGIEDEATDKRNKWLKFGPHAWLGLMIGGLAGLVVVAIRDTIESAKSAFASVGRAGLNMKSKIKHGFESGDDKRHGFRKFGPHAWLGLIVGGLAGFVVMTVSDTIESTISTFQSLVHAGSDKTRDPEIKFGFENDDFDKRHPARKFSPHAWLGILAGGIAGLATIAVVDTIKSAAGTYLTMISAGWDTSKNKKYGIESSEFDKRNDWRKFGPHAWLGLVVSGVAGLVIMTISDSVIACVDTWNSLYNAGLNSSKPVGIPGSPPTLHPARKYAPQAWLGILVGGLSALAMMAIRDTYRSAIGTVSTLWHAGLDKNSEDKFGIEGPNDKRNPWLKFGPHAWLGLIAGGLVGLAAITLRDTVESAIGTVQTLLHAGLDKNLDNKFGIETEVTDKRTDWRKFGPHTLGLVVGGLVGLAAISYVIRLNLP